MCRWVSEINETSCVTILLSWYTNNYIWNALTISHEITIFKYKKSYGENIILYFLEKHIYNNNFLKSWVYHGFEMFSILRRFSNYHLYDSIWRSQSNTGVITELYKVFIICIICKFHYNEGTKKKYFWAWVTLILKTSYIQDRCIHF